MSKPWRFYKVLFTIVAGVLAWKWASILIVKFSKEHFEQPDGVKTFSQ